MDNNEVVVAEEVAAVAENNTGIEIEPLFEEIHVVCFFLQFTM